MDETITRYLSEHENVETKKVMLTGVNDYTKRGISFGVTFFVKATTESKYSEIRHTMMTELGEIIKDLDITLVMMQYEEISI